MLPRVIEYQAKLRWQHTSTADFTVIGQRYPGVAGAAFSFLQVNEDKRLKERSP